MPLKNTINPASACVYLSKALTDTKLNPYTDSITIVSMVIMVVIANIKITVTSPIKLNEADG